jgi:hypothetical protein
LALPGKFGSITGPNPFPYSTALPGVERMNTLKVVFEDLTFLNPDDIQISIYTLNINMLIRIFIA